MNITFFNHSARKGFTLVELLIVITILVVLGIFVILLINPAEILSKSRDSQRISDLATVKGAMQLFLTDTTTDLTTFMATNCVSTVPIVEAPLTTAARAKIHASLDVAPDNDGAGANIEYTVVTTSAAARKANDGTGWVNVNFTTVTSGAPLEALPTDPSADLSAATDLTTGKYYRFACYNNGGKFEYEFDAGLESGTWGPAATGTNNKGANDGGNANTSPGTGGTNRYEVGNNLGILGATASLTP